jgi:hypothetical protein
LDRQASWLEDANTDASDAYNALMELVDEETGEVTDVDEYNRLEGIYNELERTREDLQNNLDEIENQKRLKLEE